MRIIRAQTEDHYRSTRKLFQQYAETLGVDLEFQGFSRELAMFPGEYEPQTRGSQVKNFSDAKRP